MSEPGTNAAPWTREDTERWLTDWPLPADLVFRAEKVWPRYQTKKGFGFWLRTSGPYHPALRGLFALCHDILSAVPVGQSMPTPEQLAEKIREHEASQAELPLTAEDLAPADPPGLAAAAKIRSDLADSPAQTDHENPL